MTGVTAGLIGAALGSMISSYLLGTFHTATMRRLRAWADLTGFACLAAAGVVWWAQ